MSNYHAARVKNRILDAAELERLLVQGKYATLALCRDNEPYAVTLSYGYDQEKRCLYFHCANKGHKLEFIRANPRACASILEDRGYMPTQCDHDYASLIIRGPLTVVEDLDEKKHALQVLLDHLEADTKPIWDRNIKGDHSFSAVTILRLSIEDLSGKQRVG